MTDAKLKSLAERIERLMDERDGIQADIRDIYAEAKGVGYVPKVLRKAITRKRMDAGKRDEEDAILDLYESALSPTMRKVVAMAKAGASSHQIEQATGVDHATVARSVALNKKSATPHDEAAAPLEAALIEKERARTTLEAELSGVTDVMRGSVSVGAVAGPEAERVATPEPDDLEIPAFLDRRSSTGTSAQ